MPSISVIVPVRNEAKGIEPALRALLTQEFPRERFEVIVADGASTDETVPIVRRLQSEFDNLKLVFNPDRLSSAARNTAIRHSKMDVAVIVDGHCSVPDRILRTFRTRLKPAARIRSAVRNRSTHRIRPRSRRQSQPHRASRLGHNPDSDIFSDEAKFVDPQSTAVAYSRSVFHRIGLFDQAFDACEDVEFNQRVFGAGLTCYFTPTVKVLYHPRSDLKGLFYQLSRYGMGRARLAFKDRKSLTPPALVPPLFALWAVLGWLPAIAVPEWGLLWLASMVFYMMVLCGAGAVLARGKGFAVARRVPLVFAGIHFGFAWGFWREVYRQLRPVAKPQAV